MSEIEKAARAYAERNKVVAALASVFPAYRYRNPEDEPGWFVVGIDLPTGQATWHFRDDELPLVEHLPETEVSWDGHTTAEKYERLRDLPMLCAAHRIRATSIPPPRREVVLPVEEAEALAAHMETEGYAYAKRLRERIAAAKEAGS